MAGGVPSVGIEASPMQALAGFVNAGAGIIGKKKADDELYGRRETVAPKTKAGQFIDNTPVGKIFGGSGLGLWGKGKRSGGLLDNRPQYQISPEYQENENIAANVRDMYGRLTNTSELPGQTQMQNKLAQNSANATGSAAMYGVDNPALLAQLANSTLQLQDSAQNDLNIEGAKFRQINIGNYADASRHLEDTKTAMAEEKDKAWNYNINDPYQNKIDSARKRIKSNTEMIQKGGDMVGSSSKISASI